MDLTYLHYCRFWMFALIERRNIFVPSASQVAKKKVVNSMNDRNNCKLTTLLGLFYPCLRISSSTEFAKRNKRMMSLKTIIIIIMQSDVLSSIDIQSWWCKMLLLVLMTHVSLQFGWSCSFEQMKYIVLATVTYS